MEDPLMPPQRTSCSSLRSQDLPSNNELFDFHSTKPRLIDINMAADISRNLGYEVYNNSHSLDTSPYEYDPLPQSSQASIPDWGTSSKGYSTMSYEFSPKTPSTYTYYQLEAEKPGRRQLNRNGWESSQWENGLPGNQRHEQASMTCPRNFPQDANTAMNAIRNLAARQDHSENVFRPSSPYFVGPPQQSSHADYLSSQYRPKHSDQHSFKGIGRPRVSTTYRPLPSVSPALSPLTVSQSIPAENSIALTPETTEEYDNMDISTIHQPNDDDLDGELNSEPYAQLIYRALKSAPEHRMVLKEIYEWFEKNTDKANDGSSKGWQNSIRHNLSMNGAFRKVDQLPPSDDGKKGFVWVLEPSALINGVESTTRYRKQTPHKKSGKVDPAGKLRQRCGAKGGRATKRTIKMRLRAHYEEPRNPRQFEATPEETKADHFNNHEVISSLNNDNFEISDMPYYLNTPSSTVQSSIADTMPYGFEDITGCASTLENEPLFCSSTYDNGFSKNTTDPMLSDHSFYNSESHLEENSEFGYFVRH